MPIKGKKMAVKPPKIGQTLIELAPRVDRSLPRIPPKAGQTMGRSHRQRWSGRCSHYWPQLNTPLTGCASAI